MYEGMPPECLWRCELHIEVIFVVAFMKYQLEVTFLRNYKKVFILMKKVDTICKPKPIELADNMRMKANEKELLKKYICLRVNRQNG